MKSKIIIGWREWVGLPDLGIDAIKAKVDTGAKTSAIHAYRIKEFRRDGRVWVRFYLHPLQRHRLPEIKCELPIADRRGVTSSNGERQERYVVRTSLRLGMGVWPVELTLTNRDEMGFRLLIGREALKGRAVVDPEGSFSLGALDETEIYPEIFIDGRP